jgi:hypothetical protein
MTLDLRNFGGGDCVFADVNSKNSPWRASGFATPSSAGARAQEIMFFEFRKKPFDRGTAETPLWRRASHGVARL